MKNISSLSVAIIVGLILLLVLFYFYRESETFEDVKQEEKQPPVKITIPSYLPAKVVDDTVSRIPRRVIRCFATNEVDEIFKDSVNSVVDLNPDYEHVFFTDQDCLEFMRQNYPGRVSEAYETLIPGAYKSDLFRICYLYKHGGVYIDINKVLLEPLRDVIPNDCDLFTVIDIPKCCIWQAFLACRPELPFIKECIDKCVKNIENRYYGKSVLSVTGPGMMGEVYRSHYGVCVAKPGLFTINGDKIKLCALAGFKKGFAYDGKKKVLDLNRSKRLKMDSHWKNQTSVPHYSVLWSKRMIYTDDYRQKSSYNK